MGIDPKDLPAGSPILKAYRKEVVARPSRRPGEAARKQTASESALVAQLMAYEISGYRRNHRLMPGRKWEADFAWIDWRGHRPEPVRVAGQDEFAGRLVQREPTRCTEDFDIVKFLSAPDSDGIARGWAYYRRKGFGCHNRISDIQYPPVEGMRPKWIGGEVFWDKPPEEARSLAIFIDGRAHLFEPTDGLNGSGGKRSADCERQNVLALALPEWTVLYATPSQVRRLIVIDAVRAWLDSDIAGLLAALQRTP